MGWTLGDFALSSCRMRNPLEMKKDLNSVQPCHGADPMWIQFYESSFWENWHVMKAYYFPMMALYLQAYTDAIVQDWRGYTDVFACIQPEWKTKSFSFHGIHTLGGTIVSGEWNNGQFEITIEKGNSEFIDVRVSQPVSKINVTGQSQGPSSFKGNETVKLRFDGKKEIILKGQLK